MPFYDHRCQTCNRTEEVCCSWVQLDRMTPQCCGARMRRDYGREHAGLAYQEKGFFPYIDENVSKDGIPIQVRSRSHWKQLMRENGVHEHEQSAEGRYRFKHIKDRSRHAP